MRKFIIIIIKAFSTLFFCNEGTVIINDSKAIEQKYIKYTDIDKYSSGILIATTHRSYLDGVFLNFSMPRKGYCLAKIELFENKIKGFIYKNVFGFIPITREKPKVSEIKKAINILKRGDILYVAPTGTRISKVKNIKRGIVSIALKANVPILLADIGGPKKFSFKYIKQRPIVNYNFGIGIDVRLLVDDLINQKNFTSKSAEIEATKIIEEELKYLEEHQDNYFCPNVIKSAIKLIKNLYAIFKYGIV